MESLSVAKKMFPLKSKEGKKRRRCMYFQEMCYWAVSLLFSHTSLQLEANERRESTNNQTMWS